MSHQLLNCLIEDHQNIRSKLNDLRALLSLDRINEEHCLEKFQIFKATVVAHSKAEEFALYALVEEPRGSLEKEMQHFAYEGYEEHDLIDFLMKEMGTAEEIDLQWRAQLVVLGRMLEHHLKQEEENFFPKAQTVLSEKASADLAVAYTKERDLIFAKKTGMRPAISLAPSLQH